MNLSMIAEELQRCNRCGFCQAACPVFAATGHEAGVARGRVALLTALLDGELTWSPDVEEPLFACLLCGACTASCFPAVPTADLVRAARRTYLEESGRKPAHRLLFDHLLPHPARLRLGARAAAAAQRAGSGRLAGALSLLRFMGPDLAEKAGIPGRLPAVPFRDRFRPGSYAGSGRLTIAYFVGCGMDITAPDAAARTLALLRRAARRVDLLPNVCCGLPAETYGDRRAAQRLARTNMALVSRSAPDLVVTDCSSCASFLKQYPVLFDNGPEREAARAMAARTRDFLEILDAARPGGSREPARTVTWHDPCHAIRGQGIQAQPRRLLSGWPGVDFREMREADWCCGGAGSYSMAHYRLARAVMDRKAGRVAETGAALVVTSCPSCRMHLDYGCRQAGLPTRAVHVSELVDAEATEFDLSRL